MTNYTMPVLSEQEREKAIVACKDEIGHLKQMVAAAKSGGRYSATGYQSQLIRQQIALAALTAEPVGYGFREDIDLMKKRRMANGAITVRYHGEQALFTAPPVPVKQEGGQCGKCKGEGWFADEMGMRRCFMCNDLVREGE